MAPRITFVTGTDTGAGKTVLTALALCHLQARDKRVAALKPFCSGSWDDTDLLRVLHQPARPRDEITPWFFRAPLAPLIAARQENQAIRINEVLAEIRCRAEGLEDLLLEGAGGLLSPLGLDFSGLNLIQELSADVLIAARNKLGVINHSLLTIQQLEASGIYSWKLVLMGEKLDASSSTNAEALAGCLGKNAWRITQCPELEDFSAAKARNLALVNRSLLDSLFF